MTGVKADAGKAPMALLPFDALIAVADVLGYGAHKYEPHNWRKGIAYSRIVSALLRHLAARVMGETHDPESGLRHSAHMACCALFLCAYDCTPPRKPDGGTYDDLGGKP